MTLCFCKILKLSPVSDEKALTMVIWQTYGDAVHCKPTLLSGNR